MLDTIDWSRPWLSTLNDVAMPIRLASDWRTAIDAAAGALAIRNHRGLPIQFAAQESLSSNLSYEAFISATGKVPTRDNLHDFFNALTWLVFPRIKVRLNALHAQAASSEKTVITDQMPHKARGKLRDAATIFDENAALVMIRRPGLADALRAHRWREAFVEQRDAFFNDCETWLFGHALLEKLVTPYKAITAHAWMIPVEDAFFRMSFDMRRDWVDAMVASQLSERLSTSDFSPLPVLGIPGWWSVQDDAFYEDAAVFRPKKRSQT